MIANLLFLLSIHMFCKNSHIWHSRFGHISNKVFNHLNNKIGLHFFPNFFFSNYFVCPLAKFRRLFFPNSNHLSYLPFDLLHCDIWAPMLTLHMREKDFSLHWYMTA